MRVGAQLRKLNDVLYAALFGGIDKTALLRGGRGRLRRIVSFVSRLNNMLRVANCVLRDDAFADGVEDEFWDTAEIQFFHDVRAVGLNGIDA